MASLYGEFVWRDGAPNGPKRRVLARAEAAPLAYRLLSQRYFGRASFAVVPPGEAQARFAAQGVPMEELPSLLTMRCDRRRRL
jgi:hypothetical protein